MRRPAALGLGLLALAALAATRWLASPAPAADTPGGPPPLAATPPARGLADEDDPSVFPPLPPPEAGDWLAVHEERGQDLEAFRASPRRVVTEERRTIRLLPLEDLSRAGVDLALLAEQVGLCFGLPAVAAPPAAPPSPTTREGRGTGRPQVLTTDILRWLEEQGASDAFCTLAVTTRDLYPDPSWNFVFGQASLRRGTGVFSFARMDPAFPAAPPPKDAWPPERRAVVLRRCMKVVAHETGHMLGMEHCVERLCLMNGSNHAAEMDRAPLHLCPVCLPKVVVATGVDRTARYLRLAEFYRRAGLESEAAWCDARVARAGRARTGAP